jgi:arylsulfatase A-like enzyme
MADRPNILLITIDTLRADHLGCYGYPRTTSPRIDALAKEGVVAERLLCPGIPTYPSYTSFYTGQHPLTHGIYAHGGDALLAENAPFVSQCFAEGGYVTCAVDNLLRGRPWFGRGYEYYINPSVRDTVLSVAVTCEEINSRAIRWMRDHRDDHFFLMLHYWDPHWPFRAPQPYRNLFYQGQPYDPDNHSLDAWWNHPLGMLARDTWLRTPQGVVTDSEAVVALYDQEIRHLDDAINELLGTLDQLGLGEDTLVFLFADHGISMTEHQIFFDPHGLYDPSIHVPFIARWPGHLPSGRRVAPMVQHLDLAPTLLDAVGLPVPAAMEGRTFWPLLTGEGEGGGHEKVISVECTWQAKWSLRTDRHKLVVARHPDLYGTPPIELYDLAADPDESRNIADAQPELTATLRKELEDWIAQRLKVLGRDVDPLLAEGSKPSLAMSAW